MKKKRKVIRCITDDLDISSEDSDKYSSDKEYQNSGILKMVSFLRWEFIC